MNTENTTHPVGLRKQVAAAKSKSRLTFVYRQALAHPGLTRKTVNRLSRAYRARLAEFDAMKRAGK